MNIFLRYIYDSMVRINIEPRLIDGESTYCLARRNDIKSENIVCLKVPSYHYLQMIQNPKKFKVGDVEGLNDLDEGDHWCVLVIFPKMFFFTVGFIYFTAKSFPQGQRFLRSS